MFGFYRKGRGSAKALATESFKDRINPTAPITRIFRFDPCDNIIVTVNVIITCCAHALERLNILLY